MKKFKDSQDREWSIAVNIGSIKNVKQVCGIDLLDNQGAGCIEKLADDYVSLIDILCCLVSDQLGETTVEQFGEALVGDVIERAANALFEDLFDFFPRRRRQVLQALWQKVRAADKEISDYAAEKIRNGKEVNEMVKERILAFDREMEKFGGSSTNSQAPSASSLRP